jgi:hypothetical protein
MSNIMKSTALGLVVTVIAACSAHQNQGVSSGMHAGEFEREFGYWSNPDTTMKLPNGNVLYVFGQGQSQAVWTPAGSVPGQHFYTVTEEAKPARAVSRRDDDHLAKRGPTRSPIVWIEVTAAGTILLAGCDGCTEKERLALAALQEGGGVHLRASTTPTDRP